jgi:hypothetical protein
LSDGFVYRDLVKEKPYAAASKKGAPGSGRLLVNLDEVFVAETDADTTATDKATNAPGSLFAKDRLHFSHAGYDVSGYQSIGILTLC